LDCGLGQWLGIFFNSWTVLKIFRDLRALLFINKRKNLHFYTGVYILAISPRGGEGKKEALFGVWGRK
jgi:hypothetical protein